MLRNVVLTEEINAYKILIEKPEKRDHLKEIGGEGLSF
jgi:hypothetical protein